MNSRIISSISGPPLGKSKGKRPKRNGYLFGGKVNTTSFGVKPLFETPGWTTLDFGPIDLALHILYPQSRESEAPIPHAGLNLEVDNIEEVQRDIERSGGTLIELREPSGGVPVRVATFKDSEGNGFELRQQP